MPHRAETRDVQICPDGQSGTREEVATQPGGRRREQQGDRCLNIGFSQRQLPVRGQLDRIDQ